ncbi:IAP-3 [Alphabaculovirus myunipunctae]|uniref:IAP-3 n=1 Tax=Mythimna unipuncta nucleopolyhedrovirus TaxID=447897 RepID=A0A2K9VSE5_9ABAC|nr:IAP-3 [Mythimna unipuncta nucleopolyhedrovirus]AUV65385.1 IAP-3 [Mythimna unipuncta nucleopolyhedrovirus]
MKTIEERLITFANWPSNNPVRPEELARNGFYYLGVNDEVRCAYCKVEIYKFQKGDNVENDHRKWAPQCPFVRKLIIENTNVGASSSEVGIDVAGSLPRIADRIAYPKYVYYQARFDSLRLMFGWENSHRMAQAGFFYEANENHPVDLAICYSDGCALNNWSCTDDPFVEHARWFPTCRYMIKLKGHEFIQKVISESCAIKEAAAAAAAAASVNKDDDDDETNDKFLCGICLHNRKNVCFVPCGHVVSCANCALKIQRCPVCRRQREKIQPLYFC